MAISGLLKGLAGLAVGAALICNLPTRLWMSAEKATLQYLADTSLQTVDESQRQFKVISSCTSIKVDLFDALSATRNVLLLIINDYVEYNFASVPVLYLSYIHYCFGTHKDCLLYTSPSPRD